MQSWRRYTIVGVLAFLAGVAVWASMAWTDTVNYDVPRGQTGPAPVKVACGRLFGGAPTSGRRQILSANAYNGSFRLSHKPCSGRASRRILVVIDAVVGVAAVVVLLTRFSPRPIEPATA